MNAAKAAERQGALQKFRMSRELERDMPAHERRKAASKAANMTPADIAARMSQPADERPSNPPDMRQTKLKGSVGQRSNHSNFSTSEFG